MATPEQLQEADADVSTTGALGSEGHSAEQASHTHQARKRVAKIAKLKIHRPEFNAQAEDMKAHNIVYHERAEYRA